MKIKAIIIAIDQIEVDRWQKEPFPRRCSFREV
jgi:hypothetical protein